MRTYLSLNAILITSLFSISISNTKPHLVKMNVSAYCPCESCCGRWAKDAVNASGQRITASGHVIRPGDKFIAADKSLPFGTKIYVPGYGTHAVEDRGGAIKGHKLDLYFDTHQKALAWGRKQLTCTVYR